MLLALLYSHSEQIIAAAPACDQVPFGDQFWCEVHAAEIATTDIFETAYVTVTNSELRDKLLKLGIDPTVDGVEMTQLVEAKPAVRNANRAA
jgi:hypothetical protein